MDDFVAWIFAVLKMKERGNFKRRAVFHITKVRDCFGLVKGTLDR